MSMTPRDAILTLLARRGPEKSICPSEAARLMFDGEGEGWRESMPVVREAAASLVDEGLIDVTQRGVVIDPRITRGPIRLRSRSD